MSELLECAIELVNDKLEFKATAGENPPITLDYIPPLGDGHGYMPMQLLLISLVSCSGSTIVSILRKKRKTVASFTAHAKGFRREQHPTSFHKIELFFELVSPDTQDADMTRAIELSEETFCPVWDNLKCNCEILTQYSISS
jgi:putative redox protein